MKLTTSPDGTVHVEGTPEEVRALLAPPKDAVGKMLSSIPPGYTVRAEPAWLPLTITGVVRS